MSDSPFVAVFACLALMAQPGVAAAAPVSGPKPAAEFRRLRATAVTADDFERLAGFCRRQSAAYAARESAYRAEMEAYHRNPSAYPKSKYPSREHSLNLMVGHAHELSLRWQTLSDVYAARARALEASPSH